MNCKVCGREMKYDKDVKAYYDDRVGVNPMNGYYCPVCDY